MTQMWILLPYSRADMLCINITGARPRRQRSMIRTILTSRISTICTMDYDNMLIRPKIKCGLTRVRELRKVTYYLSFKLLRKTRVSIIYACVPANVVKGSWISTQAIYPGPREPIARRGGPNGRYSGDGPAMAAILFCCAIATIFWLLRRLPRCRNGSYACPQVKR